ncbi:polysaccharide deacetylase family protein [Gramella sp. MAR_2010_147]|uniref:polysaccharide deacetylase family protein n=1 Tax=Gramella sp. MAR_2010_147 TaxID=1250205 RepID=UPI00087D88DA|nr:polysaccharide deacetylase family protein [Gramella sp. MAR_2010_147]SDR70036.1 Polysaccharide deacetylase [Gramella sp. MAR_2010_147]
MKNGALVVSLDFELLWGVFDKVDWKQKQEYFLNTRKLIPEILRLFEQHEVSCTWATVGMLFNDNWDEWNYNIPKVIPEYRNKKLSAYNYGKSIQSKETEKLCFAPDLIRKIKETQGQEIGTHTYSHYYCRESGQTVESFRADLLQSKKLAKKVEIKLNSLVFPRNQINPEYLKLCQEIGLSSVRSNPDNWYWKNTHKDSLLQKIFRTGDAYLGTNDKSYKTSKIETFNRGLEIQKASRLLRPHSSRVIQNKLKIRRIFSEMEWAAKQGEIYHLWWHPHNFGKNPLENIMELKIILEKFSVLNGKYGFNSKNMNSVKNYSII